MSKPLEELYLADCPFCDYRRLFSSEVALVVRYGMHLHGHEDRVWERPAGASRGDGVSEARIIAHAQRIQAAPFN